MVGVLEPKSSNWKKFNILRSSVRLTLTRIFSHKNFEFKGFNIVGLSKIEFCSMQHSDIWPQDVKTFGFEVLEPENVDFFNILAPSKIKSLSSSVLAQNIKLKDLNFLGQSKIETWSIQPSWQMITGCLIMKFEVFGAASLNSNVFTS